jgi:hypothetical protein
MVLVDGYPVESERGLDSCGNAQAMLIFLISEVCRDPLGLIGY